MSRKRTEVKIRLKNKTYEECETVGIMMEQNKKKLMERKKTNNKEKRKN